jgi:hypothetical protein
MVQQLTDPAVEDEILALAAGAIPMTLNQAVRLGWLLRISQPRRDSPHHE